MSVSVAQVRARALATTIIAAPRFAATSAVLGELGDTTVTRPYGWPRTRHRAIGKRLILGLLLTLLATAIGWTLVPPQLGTDAKTVYWYTH